MIEQYKNQNEIAKLIKGVQLKIDFTKLAKIAHTQGMKEVSRYLIKQEKQIVKQIPFMLEVKQFQEAMRIAVEGGDPNNINKVISEILLLLKKPDSKTSDSMPINSLTDVVRLIAKVPDGLRHLRNYAKKRIQVKQSQREM